MKITILFDGHEGRKDQFDFLKSMHHNQEDIFYEFLIIEPQASRLSKITGILGNPASNFDFEYHINECKSILKSQFKDYNFEILTEQGDPLEIILKYSRYTDFLVLAYKNYIHHPHKGHDKGLLREVLRKSHTPCLVLPNRPITVDHIIFTYDHSDNCIDAIKRFNYLFKDFGKAHASRVVYIEDDKKLHLSDLRSIDDYLKIHYQNFKVKKIDGDVHASIYNYSKLKGHAFVVLGAFGRGALSEKIEESVAEQFIEKARYPMFIFHN